MKDWKCSKCGRDNNWVPGEPVKTGPLVQCRTTTCRNRHWNPNGYCTVCQSTIDRYRNYNLADGGREEEGAEDDADSRTPEWYSPTEEGDGYDQGFAAARRLYSTEYQRGYTDCKQAMMNVLTRHTQEEG